MSVPVSIQHGTPTDRLAVVRLLDAAMLETDADRVRRQLRQQEGVILIATIAETAVGAIALDAAVAADSQHFDGDADPVRITAIAVRRRRRDRGIGRQLVAAAAEEVAPRPLTAVFDGRVRPFYSACGFEIEPAGRRHWGVRRPAATTTAQVDDAGESSSKGE